jgi:hypothetical protein
MEHFMKESGGIIMLREKADSVMLMGTPLKENGRMIRPMAMAFTSMLLEQYMKVYGKMICKTDSGLKSGRTAQNMKATTKWGKSTEKVVNGITIRIG